MGWSYWICDTRTGVKQLQVYPASGNFNRALNGPGQGGSHVFPMGGPTVLTAAQWNALTVPWARTLVVCWDDVPKYAGLITGRPADISGSSLTLRHVDVRSILTRRFPWGLNSAGQHSYWYDVAETVPGALVVTGKQLYSIMAIVMNAALSGTTGIQSLPIVLPADVAGTDARTYDNYSFTTAEAAIAELQTTDGGPDVDFEPRWSTSGTLEWLMRTGTDTAPFLTAPALDWNMTAAKPGLVNVTFDEDALNQATGVFSIGAGSEQDMVVAGLGLSGDDVGSIPALDTTQSFKDITDITQLKAQSQARLDLARYTTSQWSLSLIASGTPGLADIRLGSILRLYFKDHWKVPDGWTQLRLIGYSGDATNETVPLTVQPVGAT